MMQTLPTITEQTAAASAPRLFALAQTTRAMRRRSWIKTAAAALLALPASLQARSAASGAAPPLMLPALYGDHIDPALCLVSEKFDGVRAWWDGRELRHRSGRPVPAPDWFRARLPARPLDGELWLGRGRFDQLSAIVRRSRPDDAQWRRVRYLLFELPGAPGSFAARAAAIEKLVRGIGWDQLEAIEQSRVADRAALKRRLARTVAAGGEGLVLHLAAAPYQSGRSDAVTKLKPELDAEAVVTGHRPGSGKYAGLLGALQVETPQGVRFHIGSGLNDALRRNPPPLGSLVTYRFRELTPGGVPRFASFLRIAEPM
jgi:DNA ligase-1